MKKIFLVLFALMLSCDDSAELKQSVGEIVEFFSNKVEVYQGVGTSKDYRLLVNTYKSGSSTEWSVSGGGTLTTSTVVSSGLDSQFYQKYTAPDSPTDVELKAIFTNVNGKKITRTLSLKIRFFTQALVKTMSDTALETAATAQVYSIDSSGTATAVTDQIYSNANSNGVFLFHDGTSLMKIEVTASGYQNLHSYFPISTKNRSNHRLFMVDSDISGADSGEAILRIWQATSTGSYSITSSDSLMVDSGTDLATESTNGIYVYNPIIDSLSGCSVCGCSQSINTASDLLTTSTYCQDVNAAANQSIVFNSTTVSIETLPASSGNITEVQFYKD